MRKLLKILISARFYILAVLGISLYLNKFSMFRIRLNEETCITCGKCDKQCYIVAMEPQKYSLYKPGLKEPGSSYTCSKCLQCVASCSNGSLKFKTIYTI